VEKMKLYCLGCGNFVIESEAGQMLMISCSPTRCGAGAPILVDERDWTKAPPDSLEKNRLGGPHIEYYLGYSGHESEAKTIMIRILREKGSISQKECEEEGCQRAYKKALERIKTGRW